MGFTRKNPTPPASQNAVCPKCGHARDGALDSLQTDSGEEVHKDDCTICAKCDAILIFQSDLTMVEMTQDEFDGLPADNQEALRHVQELNRKYSPFYSPSS